MRIDRKLSESSTTLFIVLFTHSLRLTQGKPAGEFSSKGFFHDIVERPLTGHQYVPINDTFRVCFASTARSLVFFDVFE